MYSRLKVIAAVLIIGQIALANCGNCGSSADKSGCGKDCDHKEKAAPDVAPAFTLQNYDGTEVSLANYKGKIVVLEWFNYQCPFDVYHYETTPTMQNLAARYKDKDVVFLSINSTSHQKTEENKAFAEKNNVQHPILDDRSGKVGRAYKATRTPHMFIIDEKGKIVYQGAIDNAPLGKLPEGQKEVLNFVDMALGELTAGKPVTIQQTREYGCTVKYADK
ncbi:MAG: redoxin domain-containing protein [Sedimentisphaerales bacterium]|nr:redoxin domain-containing protein [Sedimentisphaerales bacterium]